MQLKIVLKHRIFYRLISVIAIWFFVVSESISGSCISILNMLPYDKDRSMSFNKVEFLKFSEKRFHLYDADQDLKIFINELPKASRIHPIFKEYSQTTDKRGEWLDFHTFLESLDMLFLEIDENSDGKVKITEYWKFCRQDWFH
tara:strand:+ start:51 stop:482 length:432 start_codon:yes stop_codon:yes gene_type:complete